MDACLICARFVCWPLTLHGLNQGKGLALTSRNRLKQTLEFTSEMRLDAPVTHDKLLGKLFVLLPDDQVYISGRDRYIRALEMAFLHLPTAAPVAADDAYRHLIKTGL